MQLARCFFLSPKTGLKRKLIEIMVTFQLEHRFTKQQIFEMYANQINLGQRAALPSMALARRRRRTSARM
jgi:penicillin-binding protein 1B